MNSNYSGQEGNYRTRRSERYRHPEQEQDYRYDDYGSSGRGGYGNERYSGTFGNQGDEGAGSRSDYQNNDNQYSSSRNYGNMGSYGGAQGFGSATGGYPSQRVSSRRIYDSGGYTDFNTQFDSGMGRSQNDNYRNDRDDNRGRSQNYRSDNNSYGRGSSGNDYNRDLYGSESEVERRFQGSDQGRYHFGEDQNDSPNYGGSRGNYMGSGYDRSSRQGRYNSLNEHYEATSGQSNGNLGEEPYGMSGYYQGGYGSGSSGYDSDERSDRERRRQSRH